jgi:hypothetical protein
MRFAWGCHHVAVAPARVPVDTPLLWSTHHLLLQSCLVYVRGATSLNTPHTTSHHITHYYPLPPFPGC